MNIHTLSNGTKIDLNQNHNGCRNGTHDHTHYTVLPNGWIEAFDVTVCDQCGGIAIEPNGIKMDRPMPGAQLWPLGNPIPEMISYSDYYEDAVCEGCYMKGLELEAAQ